MPMHPNPNFETTSPWLPKLRYSIRYSFSEVLFTNSVNSEGYQQYAYQNIHRPYR